MPVELDGLKQTVLGSNSNEFKLSCRNGLRVKFKRIQIELPLGADGYEKTCEPLL